MKQTTQMFIGILEEMIDKEQQVITSRAINGIHDQSGYWKTVGENAGLRFVKEKIKQAIIQMEEMNQ